MSNCSKMSKACTPAMAKVLTLKKVMCICFELTLDQVEFEGNSLVVVKAVNSYDEC